MVIELRLLLIQQFFEDEDGAGRGTGKFESGYLISLGKSRKNSYWDFTVCLSIVIAVALYLL